MHCDSTNIKIHVTVGYIGTAYASPTSSGDGNIVDFVSVEQKRESEFHSLQAKQNALEALCKMCYI